MRFRLRPAIFAQPIVQRSRGLSILERLNLEAADPNTTRLLDIIGRVLQAKGSYDAATEVYQRLRDRLAHTALTIFCALHFVHPIRLATSVWK